MKWNADADVEKQSIKSDMGTDTAELTLEQGGDAVRDLVFDITKEDNGKYRRIYLPEFSANGVSNYTIKYLPW